MAAESPGEKTKPGAQESRGVNAIENLSRQTGGQAPENQRVAAQVVGVAGIIAVIVGLALIPAGEPVLAVILVAIAFLLMGIALYVALLAASKSGQKQETSPTVPVKGAITHSWKRIVIRQPVKPDDLLRDFKNPLDDLRGVVTTLLAESRQNTGLPGIEKKLIRSNIFLPRPDRTDPYCEPIQLFIPKHLHANMDQSPDRNIEFCASEGLTGRTFTLGESYGAKAERNTSGELEWSAVRLFPNKPPVVEDWEHFELSKKQKQMIEPRMRWIVSLPITLALEGTGSSVIGVLNVDGLDHHLTEEEMNKIAQILEPRVNHFAHMLSKLPRCLVRIEIEDLPEK